MSNLGVAAFNSFYPQGDWESVRTEGKEIWEKVANDVLAAMEQESLTLANSRQVAGDHYKGDPTKEEHWDRVARLELDYFQGCITKYVERCWKKNGIEDLKKARHYLDKYIELKEASTKEKEQNE